ncbi:MAG: BON domain-containing protein [Chitinophagaceae bacterium]|nr:BON domain-containing protein [Chitinophagaceae bacterium]
MKVTKTFLITALLSTLFFVGCKPKDADIKSDIEAKYKADADLSGLTVQVTDGVATINGECKDDATKTKSEEQAKSVKGVKSVVDNCTPPPPPAPPVVVSTDDALTKGVMDATKDFPTVKASVNDGVVTLTGDINRSSLQNLMKSLNTLKPKKIQNQLTIK